MGRAILLLLVISAVFFVSPALGINCKGCTPLDTLTFDKMVKSFPVSLIKFDTAYPYGDKHEEFAKVAVDGAEKAGLFVGEVGIKDYGEKDNEELGKRYNIEKDDYPVVMLFKREGDKVEEFRFSPDKDDKEEFNAESLKAFLRQKTGIYLPLAGCLEDMDKLAEKALNAKGDAREKVVKEAEAQAAKAEEKDKKRADMYVKILRKLASEGDGFAQKETERTKKMLEGKITDAKKTELKEKINILRSFIKADASADGDKKEEL